MNALTIVTPSFASSHPCKTSELLGFRRVLRNYPISLSLRFWHFLSPSSHQQLTYIPCSCAAKADGVISLSSQPTGIFTLLQLLLQNISRDRSYYHMNHHLISFLEVLLRPQLSYSRNDSYRISFSCAQHTASYRI